MASENSIAWALAEMLDREIELDGTGDEIVSVSTFGEAGISCLFNDGIVIRLGNGEEYQMTIVRSR